MSHNEETVGVRIEGQKVCNERHKNRFTKIYKSRLSSYTICNSLGKILGPMVVKK